MSRWSRFVLLFALLAAPVGAQIIPSGPVGALNYWGVGGLSQVLNPGLAGQCLTTQGVGSAPVWVNCQVSSLSLLPPINTNQFYGNVSGQFSPPVGVDVNTILNTVGYDIVRPPTPESIIYKSNVGPTFNWQALPPGGAGSVLTSGGPTNPPFWAPLGQAALTQICQTVGAILYFDTPSLQWKCLAPGTAGQLLQTGGAAADPSWVNTVTLAGLGGVPATRNINTSTPLGGGGGTLGADMTLTCATCATTTNGGPLSATAPVAISAAGAISMAPIANGHVIANASGGSAGPSDTAPSTWFDQAYCNTVGFLIVRITGAWTCDNSISPSVKWFGAKCDGTTDDTSAIQAALNTGRLVSLPDGSLQCKISGTLNITVPGTGFVGSGIQSSFIVSSSTTAPAIFVAANVGHVTITDMTIKRTVTAVAGADGIGFAGGNQLCVLSNLWIEGNFNGLSLSNTTNSRANHIVLHGNQGNGLFMTNTATLPGFQWILDDILSELNGARGFLIAGTNPSVGTATNSAGEMSRLYSFGNSGEGFLVSGTANSPIAGIRLSNSFFGGDGSDEVSLDTFSGEHVLTKVFTELAGTSATGPTQATPASHLGSGFNFSTNNTDIELIGARSDGHSVNGLVTRAASVGIVGGQFTRNGAAGSAPGISILAGGPLRIIGVRSGSGANQNFGIAFAAAVINAIYDGCDLTGNTGGPVSNASTGTVKIGTNLP